MFYKTTGDRVIATGNGYVTIGIVVADGPKRVCLRDGTCMRVVHWPEFGETLKSVVARLGIDDSSIEQRDLARGIAAEQLLAGVAV